MAISTCCVNIFKYLHINSVDESIRCHNIAKGALACGIACCILGVGTAAVSIEWHMNFHLCLAGLLFELALASMCLLCLIDKWQGIECNKTAIQLRRILLMTFITANITLALSLQNYSKVGSISELIMAVSYCLFMTTFLSDLKGYHLRISFQTK